MRRIMVLLCLTVTLSGPLLRQAEAASDLARALAAMIGDDDRLGTPDGGVGDDSGEMTLKAGGGLHVTPTWAPSSDPLAPPGSLPSPLDFVLPLADPGVTWRGQGPASWLPIGACQRHAWLQRFLF